MSKLFFTSILCFFLISMAADDKKFVGEILYKNSFTDLKGNDLTQRLAPVLGLEQHYYTDGVNYKATDEKRDWRHLFLQKSKTYFYFNADKSAHKISVADIAQQNVKITKLDTREKIAGFDCKILQVDKSNTTTIYYYSALVKTDPKIFADHYFGEWNQYLEATDGAFPLKFVLTDRKNGFVWSAVATKVTKLKLTAKDFEFPREYTLVN